MSGFVVYQGPSRIDGAPIVVIAITAGSNRKTGDMLQTYIMRRDIDPISASRTGLDYSICGNCPHRGKPAPDKTKGWAVGRSCYVNLLHGPAGLWRTYVAGKYRDISDDDSAIVALGKAQYVRLGTYGDPAAVPDAVWDSLTRYSSGVTGYTHQAGIVRVPYRKLMISADSVRQAIDAHNNGRRTFRVIPIAQWKQYGKNALLDNEVLCPASIEAGKKTTCNNCLLCDATKPARSIAIVAHGKGKKYIEG